MMVNDSTEESSDNGAESSEKSRNSTFSPSYLIVVSLDFFILAITDFGNRKQLSLVPSNPFIRGFAASLSKNISFWCVSLQEFDT